MCKVAYILIYLTLPLWIWIWIWFVQQHINIHDLVCVCTWSLSREDYALYLPLGAIILHDEEGYVLFFCTLRPWQESLDFDVCGRIWLSCVSFWMDGLKGWVWEEDICKILSLVDMLTVRI